jgi:hypothetical protein
MKAEGKVLKSLGKWKVEEIIWRGHPFYKEPNTL